MKKQAKKPNQSRTRYTSAYKDEAIGLAARIGVAEAAQKLGLHESQLYQWRAKKQASDGISDRERELVAEVARLKPLGYQHGSLTLRDRDIPQKYRYTWTIKNIFMAVAVYCA